MYQLARIIEIFFMARIILGYPSTMSVIQAIYLANRTLKTKASINQLVQIYSKYRKIAWIDFLGYENNSTLEVNGAKIMHHKFLLKSFNNIGIFVKVLNK